MNYRRAVILAKKTLGTTTTDVIDLNIQDPISRLEFSYIPTLMDAAMLAALAVNIIKIELVDGSDVLHSLSGYQNQALCIYDRRVPTMNQAFLIAGDTQHATFGIDFGRYLFDPELAFDPTKFRNPQLKITHNSLLVGASCVTHTLQILAHCFDEKAISPVGFLMAKQHYAYTPSAASAYQYIDLPTDHILRQILLRGYKTDVEAQGIVAELKLSEDNDKRIPFDAEMEDYIQIMKGSWGVLREGCSEYAGTTNQYDKYVTPTDNQGVFTGTSNTLNIPVWLAGGLNGGLVQRRSSQGTIFITGEVQGYIPHHCIQIPFGRQDQLDDWFDVTRVGSLRARVKSGATFGAGTEISMVLQQFRRY